MEEKKPNNLLKYVSNPRSFTLKRWFYELLHQKYAGHDNIVERVSTSLITDKDVEDFGRLVSEVYEAGYRRAVQDYQVQAEKLGIKIEVVAPQTS